MNFALFLILLIALIIILISIILYNGLKIELFSKKEKAKFEIEFKASILNIAIFKRQYPPIESKSLEKEDEDSIKEGNDSLENSKEGENSTKDGDDPIKDSKKDENSTKEDSYSLENSKKDENSTKEMDNTLEDSEENEDDKSLKEKFNEFKPLLNDLKNSKQEIKEFILSVFKDTDFKELDGYLKLGLRDYSKTAKIMGWVWSLNAVANTFCEPLHLKGEATFTEEVIDFDIHAIIKLNLLFLIFHALKLVSHKNARILIKNSISYFRDDKKDNKLENKSNINPTPN